MLLAVAGCGVLTGCGVPAAAIRGPVLPVATYAGALTTTVVYDHGGITLAPPNKAGTAMVSWSDAYITNCLSGDAICDLDQGPTIVLAEATVTSAGQAQPDGSLAPLVKDTLVYGLTWTDVPCSAAGPVPSPGSSPRAAPDDSCTVVNLVDAGTGKVLYSVQGPDI
jgi:hypothetical protein